MKHGFGSMEEVKSSLFWDMLKIGESTWKSITRLTFEQTWEKVINRRETVAMSGIPSYVWAELRLEEGEEDTDEVDFFGEPIKRRYSEIELIVDKGNYQHGLWLPTRDGGSKNMRYNIVADEVDNSGPIETFFRGGNSSIWSSERYFERFINYGLMVGQKFLIVVDASYHTDYYGESDMDWSQDIIFAEPTEMTEEWCQWLLDEATYSAEQIERRRQQDAKFAQRQDDRAFIDRLAKAKGMSKLPLPGLRAHADAEEKRKNRNRF